MVYDEKLNIHDPEGRKTLVVAPLSVLSRPDQKEETNIKEVRGCTLMVIPSAEVPPKLVEEGDWH